MNIQRIERGWAGHFIGGNWCKCRGNTLHKYCILNTHRLGFYNRLLCVIKGKEDMEG